MRQGPWGSLTLGHPGASGSHGREENGVRGSGWGRGLGKASSLEWGGGIEELWLVSEMVIFSLAETGKNTEKHSTVEEFSCGSIIKCLLHGSPQ
jgi:hypothetical protein